ncbi:MAG: acyl-CoA thioesterase [Labilithrix sp.]|nr:acyl-CoA thioesterase [Labilithrix sp.]MCW5812944.1 acyl-CoA thioesterase [Labilithrix sp.]
MPLTPTHTIAVTVADGDIDELEHANNVAYVRWLQDVAVAHSAAVGLDFEAYRRIGGVFVVRRQEIDYLRPVVRGARLEVRTWIDSAMAAKCVRATEIVDEHGTTVLRAKTTWGYVDLATARPARIPQAIRDAFMFGRGPESRDAEPRDAEARAAEACDDA